MGAVKDRKIFYRSAVILIIIVLLFLVSDWLLIGLEYIALTGGVILLLSSGVDVEEVLSRLDWGTLFFISGLFIVIESVNRAGVFAVLANQLLNVARINFPLSIVSLLWTCAGLSALVYNIPITAALIPVGHGMVAAFGPESQLLWWAIIFGATLGGNATPIGASANVIGLGMLSREGKTIGFKDFVKVGIVISITQLIMCTCYLLALSIFLSY